MLVESLVVLSLLSVPLASPAPPPAPAVTSDDDDGAAQEPGFAEKYFPVALNEKLHPAVEEGLWAFWVASPLSCLAAPVWLPQVAIDEEAPDGYFVDALIAFLGHAAPHLCLYAFNLSLLAVPFLGCVGVIPVVGAAIAGFGLGGCALVNGICLTINCLAMQPNLWWLLPVSLANLYDNALDRQAAEGSDADAWLRRPREESLALAPMPY